MSLSPMMQHYLQIKDKYKDCIIFYRLGDFYEMFFDDAVKASKLLDLTLTGRDCGLENRAPMCGIPYHASETYIAKLVELGEKVAICEQLSDPATSKGMVDRDVIRVVTAGTLIEESLLDDKKNNYIACVYKENEIVSVAWADITTGDFKVCKFEGKKALNDALSHLLKISVSEIICNDEMLFSSKNCVEVAKNMLPPFSCYLPWAFNVNRAEKSLLEQLKVSSLSAFNLEGESSHIIACGALIEYLKETQKHALKNIDRVTKISFDKMLMLENTAIKNLELVKTMGEGKRYGSLLWLLDKTKTSMGARLLNDIILSPLSDINEINYRLDGVEDFYNSQLARLAIVDTLKNVKDIERISGKISNNNLTPRDCITLSTSLEQIPSIKFQLSGFTSKILKDINEGLINMTDVCELIDNAICENPPVNIKDGGYIKEGYNKELDELRNIRSHGKTIIAEIERREREQTGIKNLKIGYNRVFGYYIEVTASFKDKVPYSYQRKQTLANAERYITQELKELEEKIITSEEKSIKLEIALFNNLKEVLLNNISNIKLIAKNIALLDCVLSFATVAKENKYCRPQILPSSSALNIIEGRHPVVEAISKERFVPNDCTLNNNDSRTMILTGPNMAGKSTYMRQTALIVIMAQIGCFTPCKHAEVPLTDKIFTRIGASDNLILDQSTFMVEMIEVANIILNATQNSLLILDEVGRGTSTFDGLSIAWSVLEFLTKNIKAKTMFATHYHELTELEGNIDGVKNYKVTVKEINGSVVFLRKIMRGGANKSFGIEVASLAGVPDEVTARAKIILKQLEKNDIARGTHSNYENESKDDDTIVCEKQSEVEKIISEIEIDKTSPMQAFMILSDLIEKVKK